MHSTFPRLTTIFVSLFATFNEFFLDKIIIRQLASNIFISFAFMVIYSQLASPSSPCRALTDAGMHGWTHGWTDAGYFIVPFQVLQTGSDKKTVVNLEDL